MTDLSMDGSRPISFPASSRLWPIALYAGLVGASLAGLLVGYSTRTESGVFEPTLVLLLRFMAALKFAAVVAAALLVHWRMTRPIAPRLASAYVAAVATMALAPGLIGSLAHIGMAASLFHAGLLGFLVLALRDTDALPRRRPKPIPSVCNPTAA